MCTHNAELTELGLTATSAQTAIMEKATVIQKLSMLLLLHFLLLLFNNCSLQSTDSMMVWDNPSSTESLDILAVVPTSTNHLQPNWERGEELMSAAEIAVNEISDSQSVLNNTYQLNIVPIEVKQCNPFINIEAFAEKFVSKGSRNKTIAIVGYFCENIIRYLSPLVGHDWFGVIQISAMPPIITNAQNTGDKQVPHFYHILPSPLVLAEVAAMLIHRLGLSEIGMISSGEYHDQHYSKISEAFLPMAKKYNVSIVSHITSSPRPSLANLKKSSARVYLVFLPPSVAVDVICNAYLQGFVWPYYAWVYIELHSGQIANSSQHCSKDVVSIAKENIILVHFNVSSYPFNIGYGINNGSITKAHISDKLNQHSNVYPSVLYDSLWAIALALKQSLTAHPPHDGDPIKVEWIKKELKQLSFQGTTGLMNFSQNPTAVQVTVSVTQMHQGEPTEIASYSSALEQFTFLNLSKLENAAVSHKQDHLYLLYQHYLTFILSTLLVVCLVFTTATLLLFIHYRKTPRVKATSFALSLCMFVGCYSLIASSLIHTIFSSIIIQGRVFRYGICWGNTFLFTVSIDLVLATVFAKTLRIYHIFNKFGKISHLWSDKGLFVLILAIVSVKVVMMIAWALVDMNHLVDEVSPQPVGFPPHYIVVQRCYSHHLSWWITIVFGYSVVLFIPMLYLAVLTRKIERKEFKDSKAITTLVALLFVLTCIGNALWFLLRMIDADIASKVVYSLGFSSAAVLCQVFLFLPKIIPPVCALKLTRIKNKLRFKARSYTAYTYRRISQT